MKYRTANPKEAHAATMRLAELMQAQKEVSITEVKQGRSLSQNRYLHLLLSYYGTLTGNTLEDSKNFYKAVNHVIYYRKRRINEINVSVIRSSADLDKDEMTKSIDRFRQYASENGYDLPSATDQDFIRWAEQEIERNERYL